MRHVYLVLGMMMLICGCGPSEPQPPTIAELIATLQKGEQKEQIEALRWINQLGAKAAETKAALVEALKSPHLSVRQGAARTLGQLAPQATDAIPALIGALKDPEPSVQQAAADSLGQFGSAASAAIPQLEKLSVSSTDPCNAAPIALKKIRKQ